MDTLTKRLAGPSTGKAGMDTVDQSKVNDIIYKASEVDPIASLTDRVRGANTSRMSGKKI
jgi:hypothetical protein